MWVIKYHHPCTIAGTDRTKVTPALTDRL